MEYADVRFCDLPGVMQHFTMPASAFTDAFTTGLMFDGRSISFQEIHESDMKLKPTHDGLRRPLPCARRSRSTSPSSIR